MSWLQRIIDRDPGDAITVPEDPGLVKRADPGRDSSFSNEDMDFPASPLLTGAPAPGTHPRSGKSILIVEDDAVVANAIKETLIRLGYRVTGIAKTGELALEQVKEFMPDLVLMDIHPATGMDGIETAGRIHRLYDVPVIYLTTITDKPLLYRADVCEPFGYIVKPCDERELQSTIETAFHKHTHDLQIREAYHELEQRIAERTDELVRINRTLAESEQRFRGLFEGVPIGIYRTTPSGQILDINPALVSLLGYPNREMLMAVSIPDLYMDPEDRQRWRSRIDRDGTLHGFEVRFRKYDGTIIWVRDTGKTVSDESGKVLYYNGNIEDITERNQAVEALRTSEEKYRQLVDLAREGIWAIDAGGFTTYVNPKMAEMLGYTVEEMRERHLYSFMDDEGKTIAADTIERRLQGITEGHDFEFITKGGKRIYVYLAITPITDEKGVYSGALAVVSDITTQKQAEEALRASEQRYRDVVEDQTEFICRFLPDGTLTFINEAYCNCFRLNRDECIGNKHPVVFPPDDAQKMKRHLAALTPENPVAWISHRIVLPSGKIRWQRWSDRAIFDKNGGVIEYQSVGRDITRQKEAEIQLKKYKGTLEQRVQDRTSELSMTNLKLEKEIEDRKKIQKKLTISSNEKDLLLREVHHRVKNNLQLIIGLIDLTKTRAHEPIVISTLTDIMAKVQTMGLVHTQLYESKRFDKINMRRQVHDLVEMIAGFYDHDHLEVTTHIDCAEIYLPVDKAIPCALALNEIISNIHKHAFKGKRSGLVEISSPVKGDLIRFVIRDNGVGLPSGFDIEKSNRLGLRLMRTLVEQQLHGNVTLTSKAGTEVVIEFPIRPEESEDGSCTDS